VTLAPGEELRLRLRVDLRKLPPGPFQKVALLYGRSHGENGGPAGRSEPVAAVQLTGTLEPGVTFLPAVVRLDARVGGDTAPDGVSRTTELTALFDARLIAPGAAAPPLACDSPYVRFEPLVSAGASGVSDTAPSTPPVLGAGAAPVRRFRYRVTLAPDAPAGLLSATITPAGLNVPGGAIATLAATPAGISRVLSAAHASVVGRVTGDITASPDIVSLIARPAPATDLVEQVITLTATDSGALRDLEVVPSNPQVTARLDPPEAAGTKRILHIGVAPGTPAGILRASVEVRPASGGNGQHTARPRLVIPVSVIVPSATSAAAMGRR
jgi:hypothetical protein